MNNTLFTAIQFAQLIEQRVIDPTRWGEVWTTVPEETARAALCMAALCTHGAIMRDFLEAAMILRASPARLFVELGDGVDFDERCRTALFSSANSVYQFNRTYPDWHTAVWQSG